MFISRTPPTLRFSLPSHCLGLGFGDRYRVRRPTPAGAARADSGKVHAQGHQCQNPPGAWSGWASQSPRGGWCMRGCAESSQDTALPDFERLRLSLTPAGRSTPTWSKASSPLAGCKVSPPSCDEMCFDEDGRPMPPDFIDCRIPTAFRHPRRDAGDHRRPAAARRVNRRSRVGEHTMIGADP